jgi:NADPH-dependent 2,4-dienoyl-CoA reductase/sulfur reductase-like enzyme
MRDACDVLVVGGGPAGLAAAYSAAISGASVMLIDDNPSAGGQIWRGEETARSSPAASAWLDRIHRSNLRFIAGARVFDQPEPGLLLAESAEQTCELEYRKLILATGARELLLPFPGWTIPNVCGAGGLQALVKTGLPIRGKRVVVAGSGPLLLAVAAYLRKRGASVLIIAEQTSPAMLAGFALRMLSYPGKAMQAISLRASLAGVPYLSGCWPVEADGAGALNGVTLTRGRKRWRVECDYLAYGFHLVPNIEFPVFLGCRIEDGAVVVDQFQETSMNGVFCAGETTGIGGLELSVAEGRIAGYAAAGEMDDARKLFPLRAKLARFAELLNKTFSLRGELRSLPRTDTFVCRCEDVTFGSIQSRADWRDAKLHTRCGMGPCQGRVCGKALEFLLGWKPESIRPPVFPVSLGSLMSAVREPAGIGRSAENVAESRCE